MHALTPLEENKSFLEKVKLGEQLCGISSEESLLKWSRSKAAASSANHNKGHKASVSEDDCVNDAEESDEDELPHVKTSIRWPESRSQQEKRPKAKLMPSFTKKSLEFHNCPDAEAGKIIKLTLKGEVSNTKTVRF